MTWFSKTAAFCATGILVLFLALTLEVKARRPGVQGVSNEYIRCNKECEREPDDPVCSLGKSTSGSATFYSFAWLRNECERKCYRGEHGEVYSREPNMELCYKWGKNRASYNCSLIEDIRQSVDCFMKIPKERGVMEAGMHVNGTTNSTI